MATQCTNCPCEYDDILMCCPECGYPAQDLPAFEAEPQESEWMLDCENGDHHWERAPLSDESTVEICTSIYCGIQRLRNLDNQSVIYLQPFYGHPPDGLLPERFQPDYENNTKEEIANWERDLKTNTPFKSGTGWFRSGTKIIHFLSSSWGIGTYYVEAESARRD